MPLQRHLICEPGTISSSTLKASSHDNAALLSHVSKFDAIYMGFYKNFFNLVITQLARSRIKNANTHSSSKQQLSL